MTYKRINSLDKVSPHGKFTGMKLDYHRDLRCGYGDYVQATVPNTDNSLSPRTFGCIALLPTGNTTGSVKMWCLATQSVITRDQFRILPMPDLVCSYISNAAELEGYTLKCFDVGVTSTVPAVQNSSLPAMMQKDGKITQADSEDTLELGVIMDDIISGDAVSEMENPPIVDIIQPVAPIPTTLPTNESRKRVHHPSLHLRENYVLIIHSEADRLGALVRRELHK